jgi:PAS domain S-box-containing protein
MRQDSPAIAIPLSSLCVAAAVLAEDGKIINSNALFEDLIPSHHEDEKSSCIWTYLGFSAAKEVQNETVRIIQKGGNVPNKWVRVFSSKLHGHKDDRELWLLQLEDVDESLRAKDRWSAILETTYDGFWDYYIPNDYEYMSPRFWQMFGYEPHEKQHKPSEWMDMVYQEDFAASMKDLQAHFESKGEVPYCRETRYRHKDGHTVWVLCRGKVIEWDEETGAPLRMIGTHTDITESKRKAEREQELISANERFKAEQQLNEFVSHEVRNPLAAAVSSIQFLEQELGDSTRSHFPRDSLEEDVHIIAHSLEYIHQLLTSMLDLNKFLEKGGVQLNSRPALLRRDFTEPVYQLYKHRASKLQFSIQSWWQDHGGKLQVIPEGHDQRMNIDIVRLKQILINIVSNAIKFTQEGFVRVQVGRFDPDDPERLTIIVEDSGPGIPKDKRNLLFEKYVQLSTQIQGSGIGLALTKQLVEAMHGSIIIDENYQSGLPGHPGTRFVVDLVAPVVENETSSQSDEMDTVTSQEKRQNHSPSPHGSIANPSPAKRCRRDAKSAQTEKGESTLDTSLKASIIHAHRNRAEESRQQRHENPSRKSGCTRDLPENLRVLIVDDDMIIRKLLSRRLLNIDPTMTVETAESGEIAIEMIKDPSKKYDLVLMDHFMPLCGGVLTGEETIRIIRPHVEGVIAGSSGNDMSKEHTRAGADLFWLKPVPKDDILVDDLKEAFKEKSHHA